MDSFHSWFTSTGSGLLAFLGSCYARIFRWIVSMRVKRLEDIHLVASRHIERKKSHFRLTFVAQKRLRLITFPNSLQGSLPAGWLVRVRGKFWKRWRGIFPRPCSGESACSLPARWRFGVLKRLKYRPFPFETPVKKAKKLIHFWTYQVVSPSSYICYLSCLFLKVWFTIFL